VDSDADRVGHVDSSEPTSPSGRAESGTLRFSNGAQVEAATCTAAQLSPPQAVSDRQGEQLFLIVRLSAGSPPESYEKLMALASDTYWGTPGSTTKALRKAAIAANSRLAQVNSRADASQRSLGHLVCAVLRDEDLLVLQAGEVSASLLHRGRLQHFTSSPGPQPLGAAQVADVRVHHAFSAFGDVLLLAAPSLTPLAGGEPLQSLLAEAELPRMVSKLGQCAAESDFAALIARRSAPAQAIDVPAAAEPLTVPDSTGPAAKAAKPRRRRVRTRDKRESRVRLWAQQTGPKVRAWLLDASGTARSVLAAAGARLARGAKTLLRRTLPGRDQTVPLTRKEEPAYPDERRSLMRAIAIGLPVLLAVLVALAYLSFGSEARFQRLVQKAQQEMSLAAAAEDPDEARSHLELARDYAADAAASRPEDAEAVRLFSQAESALDAMDHIVRLTAVQVWNPIEGMSPSRLVVRGQMLFVLDSSERWVFRLDLSPAGDSLATPTSLTELAKAGDLIGVDRLGELVDCAWVDTAGGRQTSGLLILDEDGGLFTYDPSWTGSGGGPRVSRAPLRDVLAETTRAIGTYQGKLYVLDPVRNQIWRYAPEGDTFPYPPEPYFASSPAKRLDDALDMAIDGSIYVLYQDGDVIRFTEGESQAFDPQGMTGDLSEATVIAIDPSGLSGRIYVGDPGGGRIVVLTPEGAFLAEYRTQVALDQLSALAVDETAGRLYLVNGQRLYSAPLP